MFFCIMAGCLSTIVVGGLVNYFNAATSGVILGKILAGVTTFGYLGSIACWWKAGNLFKRHKDNEARVAFA